MKKRISKIIALSFALLLLTGCTRTLLDSEGNTVKDENTGRNLTQNILCKPENEEVITLYNEIDLELEEEDKQNVEELPTCKEFTPTDAGYEGLWTSIFVKPLAWAILKIGGFVNNYGLGLMLAGLLIRFALYPLTKKTAVQSEMMKKAKPELDKLEKKYKGKTDRDSQMQKSQEMMAIYKKYQINPVSGCITAVIQMPLLIAFYEAINRVPAIFEGKFLGMQLGVTPWFALNNGMYAYIIINILVIAATFFSIRMTSKDQSGEAASQTKMMMNAMIAMISFVSFTMPVAIGLYWITSSSFTIVQNLIVKRGKKNEGK